MVALPVFQFTIATGVWRRAVWGGQGKKCGRVALSTGAVAGRADGVTVTAPAVTATPLERLDAQMPKGAPAAQSRRACRAILSVQEFPPLPVVGGACWFCGLLPCS